MGGDGKAFYAAYRLTKRNVGRIKKVIRTMELSWNVESGIIYISNTMSSLFGIPPNYVHLGFEKLLYLTAPVKPISVTLSEREYDELISNLGNFGNIVQSLISSRNGFKNYDFSKRELIFLVELFN